MYAINVNNKGKWRNKLKTSMYSKSFALFLSPIAVIFRIFGFRFVQSFDVNRIGHLILDLLYLDLRSRDNKLFGRCFILFIPNGITVNSYALEKLPKKFIVIKSVFLCKLFSLFKLNIFCGINPRESIWIPFQAATFYKYTHLITKSQPFFSDLPNRNDDVFTRLLEDLGILNHSWYICLHNREGGYTKNKIPDVESDFRNGSINNFISTINFISNLGGAVVRMGDSSMTPFPNIPGLVDYAHSPFKSEMNDILLSANCRFFLGNTSGAHQMASAQGIPVVGVNLAAMGFCKFGSPNDIGVPKLYLRESTNKPIPFEEIFHSKLANFYKTQMFSEAGVYLNETPEDEITEAVKQMIDQLNGKFQESPIDKVLQYRFNALFNITNYSFYSQTKISSYFLRKHKDLLLGC